MPWQELSPMDLRMRFVTEWQSGCWTMTELCADYQISRKTGYKWVDRYEASGPRGLHDQSRRPHQSPWATAPRWWTRWWRCGNGIRAGARRNSWPWRRAAIARQPGRADRPCAISSKRAGWCRRGVDADRPCTWRRPCRRSPDRTTRGRRISKANFGRAMACTAIRSRCATASAGSCCGATRWAARTYEATRHRFERAFAEYGLPDRIRSDNGGPFAGTGLGRLSRLSVWWMRLGIIPERIALGHPEQNGSHEQFHSVLKAETARPPAAHARAQQRRFGRFCLEYNHERPHEALHDDVPASCYQPSPRSLPRQLPPLEYPGHVEIRRVSPIGQVSWRGAPLFLSEALAGEPVAFEEVDDGLWTLRFATVALARYDERHRAIHPIASLSSAGRSASCAGSAPDRKTKC